MSKDYVLSTTVRPFRRYLLANLLEYQQANNIYVPVYTDEVRTAFTCDVGGKYSRGHPGPPYREGGEFYVRKAIVKRYDYFSTGSTSTLGGNPAYAESGLHTFVSGEFPHYPFVFETFIRDNLVSDPMYIDDGLTFSKGATGWKKFSPGRPAIRLGQDVLEIRDIPRAIASLRDSIRGLHSLASKHLAWEFGVKPVLDDLRKIHKLQTQLHLRLSQLIRDNGRPVRRRGTISKSVSSPNIIITPGDGGVFPGLAVGAERQVSDRTLYDSSVVREATFTFSARFRYWVPDIGSQRWTDKAVAAIYGLNVSPSLVYQVTPWSWLIDWFSNLGDVMDNLSYSAAENLVADYAYVMGTQRLTRFLTAFVNYSDGSSISASLELSNSLKDRRQASPFGFGIKRDELNLHQLAILTSLGLQRLKF